MAEIEPVTGSTGAPVETEPVGTPVATGGPPAVPPPPARPAGMLRWGIALITLAVMVGVVSVGVALMAAGTAASAVQGWLPKDTVAYVEIRADFPGDQRANVGDIIAKFPGFADQASLDAKVDEALERLLEGAGVSWGTDIKPWLGGEVGVAVTSAAFDLAKMPAIGATDPVAAPDDGGVVLVAVKDGPAAMAWVSKHVGGTQATETYAGGEITIATGLQENDVAFAVRGSVLVLGPVTTVKAALDTAGASPLASDVSFAAARKTAPSTYIAFGYLNMKAFVDALMAAAGDQAGAPQACVDQLVGAIPAWTSGSVRAGDDVLIFESTSPTPADAASTGKASASAIASRLPATTLAAIEVRDLGPRVVDAFAAIKELVGCDPETAKSFEDIENSLASVGGLPDLIEWADDTAIAVEFNGGTFGGGLAATVSDEAAAGKVVDQLQAMLAIGGTSVGIESREEAYGTGSLLIVRVAMSATAGVDVPEVAVTVQGGVFVVGTLDFVKHVVDTSADSSLATADTYERAISAAGGDGISDVFVDITALRTAIESLMPAAEMAAYQTEVKPFLEPFEAFASVAEAPGDSSVSRAVLTFTK